MKTQCLKDCMEVKLLSTELLQLYDVYPFFSWRLCLKNWMEVIYSLAEVLQLYHFFSSRVGDALREQKQPIQNKTVSNKTWAQKGRGHHGQSILLPPATRCWLAVVDLWTSEVGCLRGERKWGARQDRRRRLHASCVTIVGYIRWGSWLDGLAEFTCPFFYFVLYLYNYLCRAYHSDPYF